MTAAYNEIMEHIEVTPEMRRRVLENVEAAMERPQVARFSARRVKTLLSLAACAALIIFAALSMSDFHRATDTAPEESADAPFGVSAVYGIEECAGRNELSEKLGFDVAELGYLPFEAQEIEYCAYWGDMAQISYRSGDDEVTFRQARGSDDISGDYNVYGTVLTVEINGAEAELRGKDGEFSGAVWQKDGFAYSVSCSPAVPQDEIQRIIESAGK